MKTFKVLGFALLTSVVFIIAGCGFMIEIMTPENYETTVNTGGTIEGTYLAHGTHAIAYFEENTNKEWKKYEIYYPADLKSGNKKYPVIVMSNGSGVWASRYFASFKHLASWGFIVIGNEHNTAFAGNSSDASLKYLIDANKNPNSVFYRKVDLKNVGIVGHSQGGVGVFNAITSQPNGNVYKTAVSLSPVGEKTADALKWTYYPSKVTIPMMLLAGTENDCITLAQLQAVYSKIKSVKVMAIRKNANHPQMLYSADGYVTAWFMWQLQNDKKAAKAFVGKNAEILKNSLYQNVQTGSY